MLNFLFLLKIEEARKKDEENGIEVAKILDGFIKRKVIKQTVMTTVYGVTWFGAKLQIARQLKGNFSVKKSLPLFFIIN